MTQDAMRVAFEKIYGPCWTDSECADLKSGFIAAHQSREAEVQRLREKLRDAHKWGWTEALYQRGLNPDDPDFKTERRTELDSYEQFISKALTPAKDSDNE